MSSSMPMPKLALGHGMEDKNPSVNEKAENGVKSNSQARVEVICDHYVFRTPGTLHDTAFEPIEPNPFPVGSVIQFDVSHPHSKLAATRSRSRDEEGCPSTACQTSTFIKLQVTHVYWPPTMSTVYRVRKLGDDTVGDESNDDSGNDRDTEAILKIFDPRLCKARAYEKEFLESGDIILKWDEEKEQAARRFLQSDREPFFFPSSFTFPLLEKHLRELAKKLCKEIFCEHYICKDDDETDKIQPDGIVVELGEAVVHEAELQLRCEVQYRTECIAYDRLKFGSSSQGTIVPQLYAKGRVNTACQGQQRTYAPHALLLEYIDGVTLDDFLVEPGTFYLLEDEELAYGPELQESEGQNSESQWSSGLPKEPRRELPKSVKKTVYSWCQNEEERSKKKTAVKASLLMLAQQLIRWIELGVMNDDLFPRNVIYVDNPRPGQGHFRIIDFNTCDLIRLSHTALANEETKLMMSDRVWNDGESKNYEMDGFELCQGDDDLPPNRFLTWAMTKASWEQSIRELLTFQTWKLVNVITELPFFVEEEKEVNKKPWRTCSGILAEISPPVWNIKYWNPDAIPRIPLASIKDFLDEIWSTPEGIFVGAPFVPDTL